MQLHEQYRPRAWHEVVGQDKVIQRIEALKARSLTGRAFWVAGVSGSGKTTIARLIAQEVADDFDTLEVDAGEVSVSWLRDVERGLASRGLTGRGRAVIVNEAHGLRKDAIRVLLVMLTDPSESLDASPKEIHLRDPVFCMWCGSTRKWRRSRLGTGGIH